MAVIISRRSSYCPNFATAPLWISQESQYTTIGRCAAGAQKVSVRQHFLESVAGSEGFPAKLGRSASFDAFEDLSEV